MTNEGENGSGAAENDSAAIDYESSAAENVSLAAAINNEACDVDDEGEEEKGNTDSEFELNPDWVSDEDIADREDIISKVQKVKEKLHLGIPVTYHSDDEVDRTSMPCNQWTVLNHGSKVNMNPYSLQILE
ncbi:unnamed protein product [Linum trigynum]|uniref:Uncharacterized protein n=1 Tax=Linum trigynum TaxID=586398 RepID=A0AAV2FEJ7_9ROSI